jgi:hypothetical protein
MRISAREGRINLIERGWENNEASRRIMIDEITEIAHLGPSHRCEGLSTVSADVMMAGRQVDG